MVGVWRCSKSRQYLHSRNLQWWTKLTVVCQPRSRDRNDQMIFSSAQPPLETHKKLSFLEVVWTRGVLRMGRECKIKKERYAHVLWWVNDFDQQCQSTIFRKHSLKTLNLKARKMDLSGWIAEKIKTSKSPEHFCLLIGDDVYRT